MHIVCWFACLGRRPELYSKENALTNFIDFGAGFGGLRLGYFNAPRTLGLTVGEEF
jgi:hypothetical protein